MDVACDLKRHYVCQMKAKGQDPDSLCPASHFWYKGECLRLVTKRMSFSNAQEECANSGGIIGTPKHEGEFEFWRSLAASKSNNKPFSDRTFHNFLSPKNRPLEKVLCCSDMSIDRFIFLAEISLGNVMTLESIPGKFPFAASNTDVWLGITSKRMRGTTVGGGIGSSLMVTEQEGWTYADGSAYDPENDYKFGYDADYNLVGPCMYLKAGFGYRLLRALCTKMCVFVCKWTGWSFTLNMVLKDT